MKSTSSYLCITLVLSGILSHGAIPPEMTVHMNTKVSPCDNFYQYACGNWINNQDLPPSLFHMELIDPLYHRVQNTIQQIIDEKPPLIGKLWDSCMAIDKINAVGNKPLKADLDRIAQAESHTRLFKLMGEFSRTGTQAIVMMNVGHDYKDATTNSFRAQAAELTLPSLKYYEQDKFSSIESHYREYINHVISLSGYSFSGPSAADVVIQMEQSIRSIKMVTRKDNDYPHLLIKSASERWPCTFDAFFQGIHKEKRFNWNFSHTNKKIPTVQLDGVDYFDLVEDLVKAKPMDDLKVYVAFVLIHSRIQWLGDDFLTAHFKFFGQKLRGRQERAQRRNFCRARINQYLPQLIGEKYASKVFDKETNSSAIQLLKRIQSVMKHRISTLPWLDEPTRREAKAKLENLKVLIGQSKIPPRYTFTLSRDNYAGNIYTILLDAFKTNMKKAYTTVNRDEWGTSPAELNAYYMPIENKLVFSAAILQPPMFAGHSVHPASNFGAIGTTMGHELTHGFDTIGCQFDAMGNEREWMTQKTMWVFTYNAICFEDLYSSFKMYGKHRYLGNVDGKLTLHENIADSGGVSLAWDAYREYMTTVQPNTHDVTQEEGDQMFFIAYAQSFCTKSREEFIEERLMTDTHAPSQWRINGVVMNSEKFSKVFKCGVDTPMNPISKCKIW